MYRFYQFFSVVLLAVFAFVTTVLMVALFASSAHASMIAGAAEPNLWSVIEPVLDAARGGHGWLASAFGLVALATLARRFGTRWVPWFGTSAGSAVLAFATMFGASLSAQLMAGQEMSLDALRVALDASGIYSLGRAVLVPALQPLAEKWGGWRGAALSAFLWALSKPDRVAESKDAGEKAVDNDPPLGIDELFGPPKDLP